MMKIWQPEEGWAFFWTLGTHFFVRIQSVRLKFSEILE